MYIKTINFWRHKPSHWSSWPLRKYLLRVLLARVKCPYYFNLLLLLFFENFLLGRILYESFLKIFCWVEIYIRCFRIFLKKKINEKKLSREKNIINSTENNKRGPRDGEKLTPKACKWTTAGPELTTTKVSTSSGHVVTQS